MVYCVTDRVWVNVETYDYTMSCSKERCHMRMLEKAMRQVQELQFGLHVLKVGAANPAEELEDVRNRLRRQLTRAKLHEQSVKNRVRQCCDICRRLC